MAKVFYTDLFEKDLKHLRKKYRNVDKDLKPITEALERGETPGVQIPGIKHAIYKEQVASKDMKTGKRDGFRVIYYLRLSDEVYYLMMYAKNEYTDILTQRLDLIVTELENQYNKSLDEDAPE